jgi:hypothetical protein
MLAAGFAVGLVHALRWRKLGRPFDRDVMLLSLGFVAGLKGTAPAHALLVAVLAVGASGVGRRVRALLRPDLPLLIAIVCGGFWVVRNAVAAGNPLYPAQLRVGPWTLPGVLSREFLNGTMQLEVWRQGYAGNLTPPNLWDFYGVGNVVVGVGLVAWAVTSAMRGRAAPGARASTARSAVASEAAGSGAPGFVVDAAAAPHMIALAVACLGLFLVSPYSGAFSPAAGGRPPRFAMDNVRYLWPAFVAAFPVAALGLSRLPFPRVWPVVFAALTLALLFRLVGHLLPGFALAAAVLGVTWVLRRFGATRARLAVVVMGALACMALAAAVAWVDPLRERLNDTTWDARHATSGLKAASFRTVRRLADHRPIALVGPVDSWWMLYGRDFSGRPTYVPSTIDWQGDPPRFALRHDDRKHPDPSRWLANVERSSAAAVVIGALDDSCRTLPVERRWCASDSRHFTPIVQTPCAAAYGIRNGTPAKESAASPR